MEHTEQKQTPRKEYKGLVSDIMVYGASSIIGRFINYLLVPLYVAVMPAQSGSYGVVTNMYAIIALLLVILTYGMETGFFYFANKRKEQAERVFSTILIALGVSSLLFITITQLKLHDIAHWFGYDEHPNHLGIMLIVVALDAFMSILFANLRFKGKAIKFAGVRLFFVLINILLNIFFLVIAPKLQEWVPSIMGWYSFTNLEGYVFLANLIATVLQILFFIPELRGLKYIFDFKLFREIFAYSFPVLILGVAGILSQSFDKIIFPKIYPDAKEGTVQLGIYGAATKIAMIMAMCTQAFRYAYEPFVFKKSKEGKNSNKTYAEVMKFFIIFTVLGFLGVSFYLDVLKYIIKPDYWAGLDVVPIVMITEIFIGVYFNLAYWYKLIGKTVWGAIFSIIGCVIIIGLNLYYIPIYGYMACAWAGFIGYFIIMVLSYLVGQVKNPIAYDLKRIGLYVGLAAALYIVGMYIPIENLYLRLIFRTVLLGVYLYVVVKKDLPIHKIPILNRLMKK